MTVESNRRMFVDYLKNNPFNRKQIFTGSLSDGKTGRCALGMGCEALGVDMTDFTAIRLQFGLLAEALDIDDFGKDVMSLEYIWTLNDRRKFTFEQISGILEEMWFGDN
jgi:hypothetical protein